MNYKTVSQSTCPLCGSIVACDPDEDGLVEQRLCSDCQESEPCKSL